MKMYNTPGSKERLLEVFNGVNKININEKRPVRTRRLREMEGIAPESTQILDDSFEKLRDGSFKGDKGGSYKPLVAIKDGKTEVTIDGFDSEHNHYKFVFITTGEQMDQPDVISTQTELVNFIYENPQGERVISFEQKDLEGFNQRHQEDLLNVIQEYVEADVTADNAIPSDDELMEALEWGIDMSDPFGGARQEYQDGMGYGDEKPVNPKLRVKAKELEKFVQEQEDDEDKWVTINGKRVHKNSREYQKWYEEEGEYDDTEGREYRRNRYESVQEEKEPEEKKEPEGWSDVKGTFKDDGGIMKWQEKEEEPEAEEVPDAPEDDAPENDAPENKVPTGDVEYIKGGLADGTDMEEYDPQQILQGMEVEMEHTDDPKIALEIAMDHLAEIPDYYTHLNKMEKEAGVDSGEEVAKFDPETMSPEFEDDFKGIEDADKELETNLLGFNSKTPNASEEMDFDLNTGGEAGSQDYDTKERYKRFQELDNLPRNEMSREDKDEHYPLWKEFGKTK